MRRSWPSEWRGGITALALVVLAAIGIGLIRHDESIVLILNNLRVPAAVLLIVLALVLVLMRARLRALFFATVGGAVLVMVAIELAPLSRMPAGGSPELKVISFNIRDGNVANGDRIANYLAGSGADFVFIEESGPIVPYRDQLAAIYPYWAGCQSPGVGCGDVVLMSKLPLQHVITFRPDRYSVHPAIQADADVNGQSVRLIGVQLVRPDFGTVQVDELAKLSDLVAGTNGPVILAGDFNAMPWFSGLTDLLRRGGLQRATFEPGTFPVAFGDWGAPIDHVLVKKAYLTDLKALPSSFGSDHRGLEAGITIGEAP